MPQGTYFLARYHRLGILDDNLLKTLLLKPAKIEIRENIWTIIDANFSKDNEFYFGKLVKYSKVGSVSRVDEENNSSITEAIPELTIAVSPFVILPNYSAIAYLHVWNHIEQHTFIRRFEEIIDSSNNKFFSKIELDPILNLEEFFIRFQKFNSIKRIKSKINPPNPLFGHLWGPLKEYLKIRNLEKLKLDEEAKNQEGINTVQIKTIFQSLINKEDIKKINPIDIPIGDMAVLMSADGYGKTSLLGEINGKTEILHSYESSSNFKSDKEASGEDLYDQAKSILDEIEKNRYLDHE